MAMTTSSRPTIRPATGCALASLIVACTTTIPLQQDYRGPVPTAGAAGQPIQLQIELLDQAGQRLDANAPLRSQYQQLAESAFERAGWTLAADAPIEVTIRLEGRTPTGLVHSQASLDRNLATGLMTVGMACEEWVHDADAKGEITVIRDQQPIAQKQIDLKSQSRSCFSMLNPNWFANHQKAALTNYETAVQKQLAAILLLVKENAESTATST